MIIASSNHIKNNQNTNHIEDWRAADLVLPDYFQNNFTAIPTDGDSGQEVVMIGLCKIPRADWTTILIDQDHRHPLLKHLHLHSYGVSCTNIIEFNVKLPTLSIVLDV